MSTRLTDAWNGTAPYAKAALALGVLLIAALAVAAGFWILRDEHRPLFTDLDPRDAAAITAELERMKVPYRVGEDGRTILVDKAAVHATRLKVLGKGVDLKGTVGFEIFNNTDFGMTEFAQRINYQRALQGELARSIMALEEVKSARVHLVLPESGLLKRSAVRPKASVTLVLRGERRLHAAQIQGIQRLVAASVAEMDPAAVTVLDQQGVALSRRAEAEGEAESGSARLDAKKEVEAYLARKVAEILDRALGPGQGIVSVDVTLYHDLVKTTREDVLQAAGSRDGAVARRRETSQRPGSAAAAAPASVGASTEIEYLHGRKVEQIVSAPGGVRRISVGLLLPAHVDSRQAEGLRQVIGMAVGLNAERGDAIALTWAGNPVPAAARKAEPAPAPLAEAPRASRPAEIPAIPWWAFAALALVLLAILWRIRIARRRREAAAPKALSAAQREEMLERVRGWIGAGAAPGGG